MKKRTFIVLGVLALFVAPAFAQDHGGGESGGGCGDVLGDLIHIQRDATTGQPILAQRYIEMPEKLPGYGWGYCPIAVDAAGNELAFAPLSCDVAEADLGKVVEVDYFGRLSGGRTKERNIRMHFDEVITNIKEATLVDRDEGGRLKLQFCTTTVPVTCEWTTVDSPMENGALYHRIMKYGHIGTGAKEEDLWAHGDPAAGTQYHPALTTADYAKFVGALKSLVPANEGCAAEMAADCGPEPLEQEDFILAASFLGAAANKDGRITVDLVQYMNRILKITKNTTGDPSGGSWPTFDTLPALVRDCWPEDWPDPQVSEADPQEPAYSTTCTTAAADPVRTPNYELFTAVQEKFVDFGAITGYERGAWRTYTMTLLNGPSGAAFTVDKKVVLMNWLHYINGAPPAVPPADIKGFVAATSDALRSIQLIHNYAIPDPLWNFKKP
jgi:hypothetical protein